MRRIADGAVPSPNIWNSPHIYELENDAVDPDGIIESTMRAIRPWKGAQLLDIGCGTGYHLPAFAAEAAQVIGVEPHGDLARGARRRTRALPNVSVLVGSAQALPVPDASIDIAHARWAYFFGPGCEAGLRELTRVVRPGGTAFVIDNDPTRSTFGRWFSRALPTYSATEVDRFFSRHGWQAERRTIRWSFQRRADLEAVVRIEFAADQAALILAEHQGLEVDYAIVIRTHQY
jgi:ubiquinone/menaquinone biosynthesis C-methylase UbiE